MSRDPRPADRQEREKLRRFLAARRAGDEAAARRWWEALLIDNYERVKGMVQLESRGRLSAHERDDAVQRALIKIAANMIHTFRGETMGEWVACAATLVKGACIDTQRRAMRHSTRERPLERPGGDRDGEARLDAEAYAALERRRWDEAARDQEAERLDDGRVFLDWALPRLSPKRRAVLELDRQGVPVEEIQARLGVSRDVVYQTRHRALQDLVKMRERYTP